MDRRALIQGKIEKVLCDVAHSYPLHVADRLASMTKGSTRDLEYVVDALVRRAIAKPTLVRAYADIIVHFHARHSALQALQSAAPSSTKLAPTMAAAGLKPVCASIVSAGAPSSLQQSQALEPLASAQGATSDTSEASAPPPDSSSILNTPTQLPEGANKPDSQQQTRQQVDVLKRTLLTILQGVYDNILLGQIDIQAWMDLESAPVVDEADERGTQLNGMAPLVKLIGHLYVRKLIPINVIDSIVQDLIGIQVDLPEKHQILCVCEMFSDAGHVLDTHPKGKLLIDAFFGRINDMEKHRDMHMPWYSDDLRAKLERIRVARQHSWLLPFFKFRSTWTLSWNGMSSAERVNLCRLSMEEWGQMAERKRDLIVSLSSFLEDRRICLVCAAYEADIIASGDRETVHQALVDIDNWLSIISTQSQTVQYFVLRKVCRGDVHLRVLAWLVNSSPCMSRHSQLDVFALPVRLLSHFFSVPELARDFVLEGCLDVVPGLIDNVRRVDVMADGDIVSSQVARSVLIIFEGILTVQKRLLFHMWHQGVVELLGDILHGRPRDRPNPDNQGGLEAQALRLIKLMVFLANENGEKQVFEALKKLEVLKGTILTLQRNQQWRHMSLTVLEHLINPVLVRYCIVFFDECSLLQQDASLCKRFETLLRLLIDRFSETENFNAAERACVRYLVDLHAKVDMLSNGLPVELLPSFLPETRKDRALQRYCETVLSQRHEAQVRLCSHCLRHEASEERFKKCDTCHLAWYCSKECQEHHWNIGGHKQRCDRYRKLMGTCSCCSCQKPFKDKHLMPGDGIERLMPSWSHEPPSGNFR